MNNRLMVILVTAGLVGMGTMPLLMAEENQPGDLQARVQDHLGASDDGGFGILLAENEELFALDEKMVTAPGDRVEPPAGPPPPEGPGPRPDVKGSDENQLAPGCPSPNGPKGPGMDNGKDRHGFGMMGPRHGGFDRMGHRPMAGRSSIGNGNPEMVRYLTENYAEEMEEVRQLNRQSEEVKKLAENKFRELAKKAAADFKAHREKVEQLNQVVQEYRKTKDQKLLSKIETLVADFYVEKVTTLKKRAEVAEARVKDLNGECDRMAANQKQEIENKVKELTADK